MRNQEKPTRRSRARNVQGVFGATDLVVGAVFEGCEQAAMSAVPGAVVLAPRGPSIPNKVL
jgi:hypothetical protein